MKKTEIVVMQGLASPDECRTLAEWGLQELSAGRLTLWNKDHYLGGYRFYEPENEIWEADECGRVLKPLRNIPNEYIHLRSRINDKLGLQDHIPRPNSASLLIVSLPGGSTESHKDGSLDGYTHLRCNLNVLPPTSGGCLVVEGVEYPLGQGDLICFAADILEHSATVNTGNQPRITLSYPFIMPDKWFS